MKTINEKYSFEYNGYHFVPAFTFTEIGIGESFTERMRFAKTPSGVPHFCNANKNWDYDTFYSKTTLNKDIFLCKENGKYYSPGTSGLFEYEHANLPKREEPIATKQKKFGYSAYVTVRIDYESDRELDGDDLQEIISNLDYSFTSRTKNVDITETEICGVNG